MKFPHRLFHFSTRMGLILVTSTAACAAGDQSGAAGTGVIESGYLEASPGYIGNILGAEIQNVDDDESLPYQVIRISVPVNPDDVERIMVLSPDGEAIPQGQDAAIERDYVNNRVEVEVSLPKKRKLGFSLRLIGEPGSFED